MRRSASADCFAILIPARRAAQVKLSTGVVGAAKKLYRVCEFSALGMATGSDKFDVGGVLLEGPFKIRPLGHFGFDLANMEPGGTVPAAAEARLARVPGGRR